MNQVCIPGHENNLFGIHTALGGRMCIIGGGLPITFDGQVIGGIGVSSGSPAQDLECAQAGVDCFIQQAMFKNHVASPVTI